MQTQSSILAIIHSELPDLRRPERDRRIFASRYWNSGSAAVAIVAVYGGKLAWRCDGCSKEYVISSNHFIGEGRILSPDQCYQCGGDTGFTIHGDWAAYIGASPNTEYEETAMNFSRQNGDKLDEELARFLFRNAISEHLTYRK